MRVTAAVARQREIEAWAMRQEGYTQSTIAERLGVDESTVSKTLSRIEARVLAEMTAEAAAVKGRITAQLWQHYEDLRKLFKDSQTPQRSQRARKRGGLLQQGRAEGAETEILESKVEERIGDVAIFREMRSTLELIGKIWGVFAPQKVAPTDPTGELPYVATVTFTDTERIKRAAAALRLIAQKRKPR